MAAAFNVVVTDQVFPSVDLEREKLAEIGATLTVASGTRDEVLEQAREADALLNTYFSFDAEALGRLERCRIIARYGIGVDNIDLDAARDRGIIVTNVPDYCVEEVAAHTTAMLLALRTGGHLGWGKPRDEPWWPCIAARSYTVLHHFTSTQEPLVPLGRGRVLAYFLGEDTYDLLDEGWFEMGYTLKKPTKVQIAARPEYAEGAVVGDRLQARMEALDEEEGEKLRGLLSRGECIS
jgi:D-3-phosphoglycerate dehydrogenase